MKPKNAPSTQLSGEHDSSSGLLSLQTTLVTHPHKDLTAATFAPNILGRLILRGGAVSQMESTNRQRILNFERVCNTNASRCHCTCLTPVHGFILLLAYVLSVWVGPNIISGQPWLLLRADHFLLCSPFCTKPPPLPYSHLIDLLGTAGQLHRSLLHTSIQGEETKIPPFIPICNALWQSSELGSGAFGWMPLNEVSLASSSTPYCQCTFITLIFLPKGKHHVPKIHQFFSKK